MKTLFSCAAFRASASAVALAVLLAAAGCAMFRKSESGKEFEAWKEEAENSSRPDPVQQRQARAELNALRDSATEQRAYAQDEGAARHGPPTKAELDELREKNPAIWRTTPFGSMYFYLHGIPMYFFYNPSVGP